MLAGFAAGARVAGYLLEEQVGAGGMAVVFRARDERLGRLVALKILGPGLAADEDFRRRFIREWRAAGAVDDPHIIPVHQAGEAAGVLFIAMRYVPGGDVRTLLRRAGPLSPGQAAAIISPMASALDAAHAAGLVHRDVKPANMLVDVRPGRPDHVYLSDFGLSKGALSVGLTGSGHFLGTPGYSAPEQIQGRPVDGRADQYALACTAFELLGGAAVFPRDEVLAVMYAHLSEPPPRLTARRPGTPAAADAVFARALAKEPAGRYSSCREFADALRGAFGLPAYPGAAHEPSLRLDHPPAEIAEGGASAVAGNGAGAGALPQAADLRSSQSPPGRRDEAESWPVTQHRARHARAPARAADPPGLPAMPPAQAEDGKPPAYREQATARKPGLPRRAVLGLAAATTAGLAVTGWELSHANPRHTQTRRRPGPRPGTLKWTTTIPVDSDPQSQPPAVQAVANGIVYVSTVGEQYALRADDGAKLWNSGSMTFAGSAGKGTVYAAGGDELYAVQAIDGKQLWHITLPYGYLKNAPWPMIQGYQQGPVIEDSIIYSTGMNGGVWAVNATNGNMIWSFPTHQLPASIAVADGVAYVAAGSSVYAIRDGQEVWRVNFSRSVVASNGSLVASARSVVAAGNLVYVDVYADGDVDGVRRLHAFHATSGVEKWRYTNNIMSEYLSVNSGIVYLNSAEKGMVYALNADNGRKLWQFDGGATYRSQVTTDGDTVYVAGDQAVYALHAKNGKEIWRFATHSSQGSGAGEVATGVTPAEDTIYVADNNLHALRAVDGTERWSFSTEVVTGAPPGLFRNTSLSSGVIAVGDTVYFAGTDFRAYALRA